MATILGPDRLGAVSVALPGAGGHCRPAPPSHTQQRWGPGCTRVPATRGQSHQASPSTANQHWLRITSGEERNCVFVLTIASSRFTPGDEGDVSKVELSYAIRTQAHVPVTPDCFGKNQQMQN